jgi:hypothetical protein
MSNSLAIFSPDVEVKAPTPYQTLLKLVDTILTDEKSEIFDCSISVVDSGIFYLKLRRINEAHPSFPSQF